MHPHQIEENAAYFSRADRFDGFDRGDVDRDDTPVVSTVARETSLVYGRIELQRVDSLTSTDFYLTVDGRLVWSGDDEGAGRTVGRWWLSGCPL